MAGTLKSVKFKRAHSVYRVGDVITPNGTLRDYLVGQGYADIVETESPARPARMARKAADKVVAGTRDLLA